MLGVALLVFREVLEAAHRIDARLAEIEGWRSRIDQFATSAGQEFLDICGIRDQAFVDGDIFMFF